MKLRYYAPAYRVHKKILGFLHRIKRVHGLDYEIVEIRKNRHGYLDEQHEKEIYEKDFKPRAKILKARVGEGIGKILRSGKKRHYNVAGIIALVRKGKVEWFAWLYDPLYERWCFYDKEYPLTLGFLGFVLEEGTGSLESVLRRGRESEHEKLINEFVGSGLLSGKFEYEVPVGKGSVFVDRHGEEKVAGRKSIDLVCKGSNEDWVIEAEPELNATSLGQVLIYGDLYSRLSSKRIKRCIVCRDAEEELREICGKYVDKIFVFGEVWKKGKVDYGEIWE